MDVDRIQLKLISNCRFQLLAFICLGIIYARGAWNVFGVLFLAADSGHTCDSSKEIVTLNSRSEHLPYMNASLNSTITTASWEQNGQHKGSIVLARECDVVVSVDNDTNISMPCTYGWVYGGEFETTIVSEWDLVCVRAYLTELSTTLYMVGSMVGALVISPLSDKFGRRLILLLCLLAQAVVGACVALSPNYTIFTALRFIVGFFNMGIALCAYVMMTEIFPAKHRAMPCSGFQIFWAFGVMLTALYGYMVRDWRHLQLVFSLPNLLCAVFVWFLPESLPWLISQKKMTKAQSVVDRIARFNSIDPPNDIFMYETVTMGHSNTEEQAETSTVHCYTDQPLLSGTLSHQDAVRLLSDMPENERKQDGAKIPDTQNGDTNGMKKTSQNKHHASTEQMQEQPVIPVDTEIQIVDNNGPVYAVTTVESNRSEEEPTTQKLKNVLVLCHSSRMRLYSVIIFYLFFVNSLSYFGISLSTPVLHGNQFVNLFLLGAVEIPAYIICVLVCERIGRKVPLCLFLLTCGVMNITAMLISEEASSGMSGVRVAFVMVGKFAITGGYSVVYLYSAEIFPTSVRNHGMGVSSVFENLGSIAAPFIVYSAKSIPELPMILFGMVSVVGGIMVTAMPETHKRPLPQTVKEVESWDMCKRRRTE